MIKSKEDLRDFLECDKKALNRKERFCFFSTDPIWYFEKLLRKTEYANNCLTGFLYYPYVKIMKFRFYNVSRKLGFSIPLNVFDKGLSIAHYGTIVINGSAKIGKNCRIQEGVTIGSTGGSNKAPILGDNIFIGSGAKIIGDIKIADDVVIGANSVVVKSFNKDNITIAGVPAKKISDKSTKNFFGGRHLC
ncbi:serine O-acetyltransferase [Clostridium perfringens]